MDDHVCKQCGKHGAHTSATNPGSDDSLVLHQEIELLKSEVNMKASHINQLHSSMFLRNEALNGEHKVLQVELNNLTDKYERLLDAHRRIQKVNQNLEDKLLKIANQFETEKVTMCREVIDLRGKLMSAKTTIGELEEESESYRRDCGLAVQLLQCNPSNFISQPIESLPSEIQQHLNLSTTSVLTSNIASSFNVPTEEKISLPIASFPPTAMFYSIPKKKNPSSSCGDGDSSSNALVSVADVAHLLKPKSSSVIRRNHTFLCRQCKQEVDVDERGTQTDVPTSSLAWESDTDLPLTHSNSTIGSFVGRRTERPRSDSPTSIESRGFIV